MSDVLPIVVLMAGPMPDEGHKYRPLLQVGHANVLELNVQSFVREFQRPYLIFAVLEDHDRRFSVSQAIHQSIDGRCSYEIILIKEATKGPAATAAIAIRESRISGPVLITDVDHAVDVGATVLRASSGDYACVLPTWPLRDEDLRRWAVAAVRDSRVVGICEKRLPAESGEFVGVVGCYWFADARNFAIIQEGGGASYVSDVVATLLDRGEHVCAVPLTRADFFGDSARLAAARAKVGEFSGTVFCDLDGTVVRHEDAPNYAQPLEVLPGAFDKLQEWRNQGYLIALVSARAHADKEALVKALDHAQLPYDQLILGLPSGPRVVVNDRKPSSILSPQALALEVDRDAGLRGLPPLHRTLEVRRRLTGGSGAETLLVEDAERFFVRKRALKHPTQGSWVARLRAQYRELERFGHLSPGSTPKLYGEHEDQFEYYYDLEYLADHTPLAVCPPAVREEAVDDLLSLMFNQIYRSTYSSPVPLLDWLNRHLEEKIYPKFEMMRGVSSLAAVLDSREVVVNGRVIPGVIVALEGIRTHASVASLAPTRLGAVHGDLTFENVLWADGDVRLIDMDGAEHLDALELDLGKVFQSVVALYELWAHDSKTLVLSQRGTALDVAVQPSPLTSPYGIAAQWCDILGASAEVAFLRGTFYMALHLIRMVPFRARQSEDQAMYALTQSALALSDVHRMMSKT